MNIESILEPLPWIAGLSTVIAVIAICVEISIRNRDGTGGGPLQPARPWPKPEPKDTRTPYERWRAELLEWAEKDGTEGGFDAWMNRWRDVPHAKPKKFDLVYKAPEEICRLVKAPGGDLGAFLRHYEDSLARRILTKKPGLFKVGQWVRMISHRAEWVFKAPRLGRIQNLTKNTATIEYQGGPVAVSLHEIEPAIPHIDEWWCWTCRDCPERAVQHHPGFFKVGDMVLGAIALRGTHEATIGYEVQCGCLAPVNFGRGPEAKA